MENESKNKAKNTDSSNEKLLLSDVMAMLQQDNVLQKAYDYLDGEATDAQTTKAEKQMFVQGFLQACSWMRENCISHN